jgi:hypothetical protein
LLSFCAELDSELVVAETRLASELVSPITLATSATLPPAEAELCEACETARAISCVAALCSSTAAATAPVKTSISEIVETIERIAETAACVAVWMPPIWRPISSVALAVYVRRAF